MPPKKPIKSTFNPLAPEPSIFQVLPLKKRQKNGNLKARRYFLSWVLIDYCIQLYTYLLINSEMLSWCNKKSTLYLWIYYEKYYWYLGMDDAFEGFNHEMLTLPFPIPLNYPTTCAYEYGSTGSLRFGFFCWAIFNNCFHFSSFFILYFFTSLGSYMAM